MKKLSLLVITCALLMFLGNAYATSFPNPAPGTFGDDLDGSGIFLANSIILSIERFDLAPLVPSPPGPFAGSTFGFFFAANPANLITIFEPSDNSNEAAIVDFLAGAVLDIDEGIVQNTFSPSPGKFGFFLTPDPNLSTLASLPSTLFSVPSLNPSDIDYVGTFPFLNNPDPVNLPDPLLLLSFSFDDPADPGQLITLYEGVTAGAIPIPEPGAILMLGSGLAGLALLSKKKNVRI